MCIRDSALAAHEGPVPGRTGLCMWGAWYGRSKSKPCAAGMSTQTSCREETFLGGCLLYTSDAADDM
eukprot:996578-Alexandrium_andersonii.AAC.1